MAISAINPRGTAVHTASAPSVAMSPSAALTVGKEVFVACISDNLATADGDTTHHLVTDTHGHTWSKVFERTNTSGAIRDGVTVSLWKTKITTQIETTESITNTYQGANNEAGIICAVECVVGAGMTLAWETPAFQLADSIANSSIAVSLASLPSREYLFFGVQGAEGNDNSKTSDADHAERFDGRSGSNSGTDVHVHVATRILTGTGDTWTSSSVTSSEVIQSLTAFYEVSFGANYDETGRVAAAAATVTATDQLTRGETGRVVTAAATVTAADNLAAVDAATVAAAATVTATDVASMAEAATVIAAATVTATDSNRRSEDVQVTAAATVTAADRQDMVEAPVVTIAAATAATDIGTFGEAPVAAAAVTVTATDVLSSVEAPVVTIAAAIAATDVLSGATNYDETGRQVTAVATVTATDILHSTEAPTVTAAAAALATDRQDMVEAPGFTILATVTATDVLTGAGHFDETGRQVTATTTIVVADNLGAVEAPQIAITATVTAVDARRATDALAVNITATVTATDALGVLPPPTLTRPLSATLADGGPSATLADGGPTGQLIESGPSGRLE